MKGKDIKKAFREAYGRRVKERSAYDGPSTEDINQVSQRMGYTQEELDAVPEGANLGLGCGNPVAHAAIQAGETVLDLGSGAGLDCFLAADRVGTTGKVIGVDMTLEMIRFARTHAKQYNYRNVEFRRGEIEKLPINDAWADLVISNCTINLSPEKKQVFNEAFRALKPGGRIVIADLVLRKALPDFIKTRFKDYPDCFVAIISKAYYLEAITDAGFCDVKVINEARYPAQLIDFDDPTVKAIIKKMKLSKEQTKELAEQFIDVVSVTVSAFKPRELARCTSAPCS